MSKLHNDLLNEVEPHESADESVKALLLGIADRIEGCNGNAVKLSDLATILREDPEKVAKAVLANTPDAKVKSTVSGSFDAPSPVFEKPREGVRDGMADSTNDHRDQQFPENENTEAERERIRQEQTARARGEQVVVNTDMPQVSEADRQRDEDAKAKTEALQQGDRLPA